MAARTGVTMPAAVSQLSAAMASRGAFRYRMRLTSRSSPSQAVVVARTLHAAHARIADARIRSSANPIRGSPGGCSCDVLTPRRGVPGCGVRDAFVHDIEVTS
jgi:hypothetical protein